MVAIVIAIIIFQKPPPPVTGLLGSQIPPSLYNQLSSPNATTLDSIGDGSTNLLISESGSPLSYNMKPEFLYIGADYCPFCAAERWSILVALSKFGSFSGVTYMQSSGSDTFPNTATFSFHGSTYSSPYLSFVPEEIQDRNHQTLDTLSSDQSALFLKYDSGQTIPFIDFNNQYVYTSSQYTPGALAGMNWTQIGPQLNDPSSVVAKNIDGAANNLITAICKTVGSATPVCGEAYAHLFLPVPGPSQYLQSFPFFTAIASDASRVLV
jgi:hypothetical protein